MVDQAYLLDKPGPPAAWKTFLNQTVLPAMIDGAGNVETCVERISVCGRDNPLATVGVALCVGWGLGALISRVRRKVV